MSYEQHIQSDSTLDKIIFILEETWPGYLSESIWAEKVGNTMFVLRNIPFYVQGVSLNDIVEAERQNNENIFRRVISKGGHSAYRAIIHKDVSEEQFLLYWQELEKMGCTYEQGVHRLYAIDVPPQVNINEVYSVLQQGEKEQIWDFEEGNCEHV